MSSLWFILDWSVRISIYIYVYMISGQLSFGLQAHKCNWDDTILNASFMYHFVSNFHDQMRWSSSWSRNFILGNIYTSPFPWVVLPARKPKTRGRPVQWILELQDLRKWAARLVAHPCFEAWTKFLATSLWQGMTKLGKRNHVMKP